MEPYNFDYWGNPLNVGDIILRADSSFEMGVVKRIATAEKNYVVIQVPASSWKQVAGQPTKFMSKCIYAISSLISMPPAILETLMPAAQLNTLLESRAKILEEHGKNNPNT